MNEGRETDSIAQAGRIIGYLRRFRHLILWGILSLVVTDILALIPPWVAKEAIDALPVLTSSRKLLPYLGVIVLVVSAQAVFRFVWRRSLLGVSRRAEYLLRNDLFGHLQRLDRAFFLKHPVGDLMSRSTNDLTAIQEFVAYFGLLVVDSLLTIGTCLVLMSIIDPRLTLASLIPLPFLSLCFFHFGRKVRMKSSQVQEDLAKLSQVVQETVTGIRMIQAYTLEKVRRKFYRDAADQYIRRNVELASIRGLFYALLTFFGGLAVIIVFWMGGIRVINGALTLGGFVAFNAYLTMLIWPMMSFGLMVNLFQRGRASLERLDEIFRQEPTVDEPPNPIPLEKPQNEIRFQEVSFRYPQTNHWALHRISLHIPEGSRTGITGPVGSGKTTLLELIPRIYDPVEGSILLDGQDVRIIALGDLRRSISMVAQEPFLFSDSLSANMCFGASHCTSEEVERIVRLVRLDRDQEAFQQGWDTVVGERGITISGGQRQRTAIARAIMAAPRILILDDPFAHLDEETESEVMGNLLGSLPETTIIFTSHRTSSLRRADRIVVLEDGRISQEGHPERLLHEEGYFRKICAQQALMHELEQIGEKEEK